MKKMQTKKINSNNTQHTYSNGLININNQLNHSNYFNYVMHHHNNANNLKQKSKNNYYDHSLKNSSFLIDNSKDIKDSQGKEQDAMDNYNKIRTTLHQFQKQNNYINNNKLKNSNASKSKSKSKSNSKPKTASTKKINGMINENGNNAIKYLFSKTNTQFKPGESKPNGNINTYQSGNKCIGQYEKAISISNRDSKFDLNYVKKSGEYNSKTAYNSKQNSRKNSNEHSGHAVYQHKSIKNNNKQLKSSNNNNLQGEGQSSKKNANTNTYSQSKSKSKTKTIHSNRDSNLDLIKSLEFNNKLIQQSKLKVRHSKNASVGTNMNHHHNKAPSSLIKSKQLINGSCNPNNSTINNGVNNNISNGNNNNLVKSSQFINKKEVKYIEYISSNVKNNNSTKNTSSLSNKSSKKNEDINRDYLQTKIQLKYKNKNSLTTVHSKQTSKSKSTSRIDEYCCCPSSSSNSNPHSKINAYNKKSITSINIKHNVPLTACQSPVRQNILENNKIQTKNKLIYDLIFKHNLNEALNSESNNNSQINNQNKEFSDHAMMFISNDKILNETYESQQSTVRESAFYRIEMEKIANQIKQYHYINNKYPETQMHFYKYGRLIGRGAFGKVNLSLHVCSGRLVAIKSFEKKNLKSKHAKTKIMHEINILKKLRHPYISQILDTFETDTHIFIVLEYICGDLLGFLRKRSKIPENFAKIIFKQIIEGLKYIHQNKIVHRDIKLDNILIDLTNTVKICDFGVSRKLNPGDIMQDHCGTPTYIAPEIFLNKGYEGYSCDIWSAGVTLYYMLCGSLPFNGNNLKELQKVIKVGKYKPIEDISKEAMNLIDGMLQIDPKKRLTINQILAHPWLVNVNLNQRHKINLFTEAEKILLSKYDVDYLNSPKEDLIENFTQKNLNSFNDDKFKNAHTKSIILAPYNTEDLEGFSLESELSIDNELCHFCRRVKQANIKYELNNNEDFDNGMMIDKKDKAGAANNNYKHFESVSPNNSFTKNVSPNFALYEEQTPHDYEDKEEKDNNGVTSYHTVINEVLIKEIENVVGFDKKYLTQCINDNEINYATATYYLLLKDIEGGYNSSTIKSINNN
jgi:serine/threonine protein kinase